MAQIKIYGLETHLAPIQAKLSDVLHGCVMQALHYPQNKRAHRFIKLQEADFYYPEGRSTKYTIIEISMFEGRSIEAKKALIYLIFERFEAQLGITPTDVEITIFETPRHDWGIRGTTGDELELNYKVEV